MQIGKLFLGFNRTSGTQPSYTVASWRYVTGYWRWAIWWKPAITFKDALVLPRFGPSFSSGKTYSAGHGTYGAWVTLPLLGTFSFSTQPRMDAMKSWPHA